MLVISNNCCGGRLYQITETVYNNPFMWCEVPYDSIIYLMKNYDKINWYNYNFEKSQINKNTFIINVENNISIHYVHYKFNSNAKTIIIPKKTKDIRNMSNDVEYCKIWEYVNEKYLVRTERMIKSKENPIFLIMEKTYPYKQKYTLNDIAECNSPYKRIIITTDKSIIENDKCKVIYVNILDTPVNTVITNIEEIKSFL